MNNRVFHASQAHKLDDPQRKTWLPPHDVINALGLTPGMVIADIGAGTGYFTIPMLQSASAPSHVYAVDLQQEMLDMLRSKLPAEAAPAVEFIQAPAVSTRIPDHSCDIALLANLWHELDDRQQVLAECARFLKPQGKIAILDWRQDVAETPGPPFRHRIGRDAVAEELRAAEWTTLLTANIGSYSYLVVGSHYRTGSIFEHYTSQLPRPSA